ncbi:CAF17-like 4Fe-4S cluster assembly/insertion protein YgfZ [Novosphingobium sp. SCN 63-17]|uniref:CAF17-like 4Fe-4S cluster assembly/insertion protein YgfZ n=1 Tax=Novosphingobium sp. SCN 63-17 TaxID=1660120 RepID=UPI000869FA8E|nr:folate-binding protein [Novosphingobium sp. SCN 63-17]ODU81515.1 MAG: aminomethyltransferase [Novosphingobium sp. SCN 63-17]
MTATRLFDRAVLRLSPQEAGEDVASFLQGLVTSDMNGPLPVWAGLLTAQGKALFDFLVWRDGDDLLIDCEASAADALARRLSLYRLRRKIAIARDESLAVHWSPGEGDRPDPRLAALGQRWLAPADPADQPAPDSADAAWRAHRLALGVPEGADELGSDKTLWLETNAGDLNGVSFTKGCYVGQENTARMNWRQKVNRRLVVVPLDRSDEARRRVAYPDLGLAVDHLRVEDLPADLAPAWMALAAEGAGED